MERTNISNWVQKRYLTLLEKFKASPFYFEEVAKTLKERFGDSEEQTKVILSELKSGGYLKAKRDPKDARKKIYSLVPVLEEKAGVMSRSELDGILKKAADLIRTRVDYTFILLLLFYKRMCDEWKRDFQKTFEELLRDGWSKEEALKEARAPVYHDLDVPEEFLWENLRKDPLKISENFSRTMKKLAERNPSLKDIFTQFDFIEFTRSPENTEILRQLIELFSAHSFENVSPDILGDAYEWILRYFAPQKAKEGEVYTPREVIRLMIEILDPKPGKWLYDPCHGSGGMLIIGYKYLEENFSKKEAEKLFLFGQEVNPKTLALSKMNLLIHDIKSAVLEQGDTLLFPKFKDEKGIKKFDYVIANPPWNQDGYGEETLKKGEFWQERFPFGFPTKQSADWAWIQHMLASAKEKVVVVIDTGAVSRGRREKGIRQKILEKDLIETVILLPEKLFYNTGAPGLIIVFNRNKPQERKNKILLINATKEFLPGKPQNTLGKENIKKIVDIYRGFKETEGLSKIISLQYAIEADYNLSPSRFVSLGEIEEYRPIEEIKKELTQIEKTRQKVDEKIKRILGKA
jgi:type I restriction enzyme M protein